MPDVKNMPVDPMGRSSGGGPGRQFGQGVERAEDGRKTLVRMACYFASEKKMVVGLITIVAIGCACSVIAPGFQSAAIDQLSERNFTRLLWFLAWMLGSYLLHGICSLVQGLIGAYLSQQVVKRIRGELFEKVVDLPLQYLDSHPHGDIMSRMTNDVENISNVTAQSLTSMISGMLTVIGTLGMMLWYCWQLAILSCTTVLLTVVLTKLLSRIARRLFRQRQRLLGTLNSMVEEKVTAYHTIAAYNQQESVIGTFEEMSDDLRRTGILAECVGTAMGPVMNVISNIGFVIVAAFGGYFAIHGMISVGMISAFLIYAMQFSRPINALANLYTEIQSAVAGAERIFAVLDEPEETKSGKEKTGTAGYLSFQHVDFAYEPGRRVLKDFNLEVEPGQKIALVGATGSGKTTVVNLLMRFYDVDGGSIRIDGMDIRRIGLEQLRRSIAIVLQDTVLFSETIAYNLKYSDAAITDERMRAAAKQACCAEMIGQLPDGYQTMLVKDGANLSQGQRQLLSICRAILADPEILILDEATSSVDTRTEKQIQDAMVNLMRDRTSLIIAHRLSTVRDADKIVVLDQGSILEIGRHEELLEKKGRYYELYMAQFAGQTI